MKKSIRHQLLHLKMPVFLLALILLASLSARAQVTAVPANDFLNSLGINTHVGQGIGEASYEPLFTYTGIRNARDKVNTDVPSLVTLHNNTVVTGVYPGARFDIHDNWTVSGMTTAGTTLAAAGALLSFEGPNEPNTTTFTYNGLTGGGHAFPAGLTMNNTTGVLSGTPTTAGTYAIAINADDSTMTLRGRATFTLIVNPVANVPVITSAGEALATNSPFTYNTVATNTPTSYSAAFLPPGLSINTTTGAITGTPTPTSGTYTVTLNAINSHGTGQATLTITINPAAGTPIITSPASATATSGTAFTYSVTATNTPTVFSALSSYVPIAQYMRDLYTGIVGNSTLKNYPIFGVSEDGAENDNVGLQFLTIPTGSGCIFPDNTSFFDFGNCHNYVDNGATYTDNKAWNAAEPSLTGGVDGMNGEYTGTTWNWTAQNGKYAYRYPAYPTTDTTVPRVATETGWGTTGSGAITEAQQAAIFLDVYLSQFKRGWSYTFIYEMRDTEGGDTTGEGIYHSNSTPKASATAIHNLTTILQDTVSYTPGSMNYSIPSEPATVHDLLLQKSNGTFYLIVWDEKLSTAGNDSVTVNLGATAATVQEYDPTLSSTVQTTLSGVSTVALTLKDHPIILAISGLSGLPSPWSSADVGSVGVAGTSSYASGTFTVTGSGSALGGRADTCQFCYQQVTGDCTITARLVSQTNTGHAQAGLMIRESLDTGAIDALVDMIPSFGLYAGSRTTTGGVGSNAFAQSGAVPYWLRIKRAGSTFTQYVSTDGVSWTQVSTNTFTMAGTAYVGMAQCNHVNTALGTSTYDNISVTTP